MSDASQPFSRPDESEFTPQSSGLAIVAGRALAFDLTMVLFWVLATDFLLYRVNTFVAWGIFFIGATAFLLSVKRSSVHRISAATIGLLLVGMGLKLIWDGTWLQVTCGVGLVLAYAMALTGTPPFLPEIFSFVACAIAGTAKRIRCFRFGTMNEATGAVKPFLGLQVLLPFIAVFGFVTLFVLANPHIADFVSLQLSSFSQQAYDLLIGIETGEAVFWFFSGWLILGLLYPGGKWLLKEVRPLAFVQTKEESKLYAAYRNTLVSVALLFAAYLCFEFTTLWFREFPEDFYYAGYAHQGAFWLTVALAVSTLTLSCIFSGSILKDPRLGRLKKLAILWSILNFILAVAVLNRLYIYINFNGLTQLRVVGFLGIASVACGFALVVLKILRNEGFVWLIHRQLWVPFAATVVFALLPVDYIVNRHNTRRVLSGEAPPVVQLIAHRSSPEGALAIMPLIEHQQPEIREGVKALLATWAIELEIADDPAAGETSLGPWISNLGHSSPWCNLPQGFSQLDRVSEVPWQNFQLSAKSLENKLLQQQESWQPYIEQAERQAALNTFFKYAYRWY